MDVSYRFRRQEKYKDIFLPFVSALAAAHIFLCHDLPANPFKIVLATDYLPELGVNFLFALLVFLAINLLSRFLDTYYPWPGSMLTRLWLQFLLGVLGIMTISVIAASIYFGNDGSDIGNKAFFDVIFYMVLGYVVSINFYYNDPDLEKWKRLAKAFPANSTTPDTKTKPVIPGTAISILNLLKKHDVTLFYTDKDTTYAKEPDGTTIFWPFRIIATLPLLDSTRYFRVNRFCIIRRDAIAEIRRDALKNKMLITLHPSYNEEIYVSRNYTDEFNSWWYDLGD